MAKEEVLGKLTVLKVEQMKVAVTSADLCYAGKRYKYYKRATCRCVCERIVERHYECIKRQAANGASPNCGRKGCRTPFRSRKPVAKKVCPPFPLLEHQQQAADEILAAIAKNRPVTSFDRREAIEVVRLRGDSPVKIDVAPAPSPRKCNGQCRQRVVDRRNYLAADPNCPQHGIV